MYLCDHDIREILHLIDIKTTDIKHPFSNNEQIQPCSIDFRLSNVFWIPINRRSVTDLRRSSLLEVSPRQHWKRIILEPHECVTIKPREILLGRTYEKFTIPPDYAGKLEGRSSFARMGLAIHSTGDFINPGWRGHMPIQLINNGPHPIKLFPFIPICQLILVKLSGRPSRVYGVEGLQSKYMDDDGGPSYWWRDKRIKALQDFLGQSDVALRVQQDIISIIGVQEPEILERFETYVDSVPKADLDSGETILQSFARFEDKKKKFDKIFRWLQGVPFALLGSLSLKLLFDSRYTWYHYLIWFFTALSALIAARILTVEDHEYLGEKELRIIQRKNGEENENS